MSGEIEPVKKVKFDEDTNNTFQQMLATPRKSISIFMDAAAGSFNTTQTGNTNTAYSG